MPARPLTDEHPSTPCHKPRMTSTSKPLDVRTRSALMGTLTAVASAACVVALMSPNWRMARAQSQAPAPTSTPPTALPDAGRLLQQSQPPQALPQAGQPLVQAPAQAASDDQDRTPVRVTGFAFEGNTVLSSQALSALLQDQVGEAVPFGPLRAALGRINRAYADQGYFLARAVLPRQDLQAQGGVLKVSVLEGRLGQVSGGMSDAQYAAVQATLNSNGVQGGAALRLDPLERSLLLINERLGSQAGASLAPGQASGSTDLIVTPDATRKPWDAQLSLDNSGNRYTGRVRAMADLSRRHNLTLGDSVGARTLLAEGLQYLGARYGLPLGHQGLRLDATATALQYKLCCQYAPLEAKGRATSWGLGLRYPVILNAERSLHAEANYGERRSVDQALGITTADKKLQPLSLGLSLNDSSAWQGQWLQLAKLAYTRGRLDQRVLPNENLPKSYGKLKADYTALVNATARQRWLFKLNGQMAQTNLDSSEKLYLGGASGVRGWPEGEASGDHGLLLSAEWQYRLGQTGSPVATGAWQLTAFADAGQVTRHRRPWATALPAGQGNHVSLSSLGLGLNYAHVAGWASSLQVAQGLGHNPVRDANTGNNSDGHRGNTQVWVNLSWGL